MRLIIEYNGKKIADKNNIFGVLDGMSPEEAADTILDYYQDTGLKFDHYLDDFAEFDDYLDIDPDGLTIKVKDDE